MIIEHLIHSALASGRLVITQPKPGYYHLKVKLGGAYITLSRVAVLVEDKPVEAEAPAETPAAEQPAEVAPTPEPADGATILAFPRAAK